MANLNQNNLKLAIQKDGRLTGDTLNFLRGSGLEFESSKQRLFSLCRNFPLEILYVRYDDIPNYVESGTVDLGIVGQSLIIEKESKVEELMKLNFGFCSLIIAVPKESNIRSIKGCKNLKIATSYPNSTIRYFYKNKIPMNPVKSIVDINGSVEIAPALGVADAISDLASTGSTLALNDLRQIAKIYDSEAVLIANKASLQNGKKDLLTKLMTRFEGVLAAKDYKYIMMNAPVDILSKMKKLIPGLKSPTVSPLTDKGWVSIQTVIKEDIFWDTIEKLKEMGATGIIVLPIEKMIV